MSKQFYLTHRWDSNMYYHFGQGVTGRNGNEVILPIPQSSRTGTLRLFNVIFKTLCLDAVGVFYNPSRLG